MKKILTLISLSIILSSCSEVTKKASEYLRLKRINTFLENKDENYKTAYKKMAFLSQDEEKFYLTYYWGKDVYQKPFDKSPCVHKQTKKMDVTGSAFDRFHKSLDHAIKNKFDAIKLKDNNKAFEVRVRFYKCSL